MTAWAINVDPDRVFAGYRFAELYAAYLEWNADATRAIVGGEELPRARENAAKFMRPMTKEQYWWCLENLEQTPGKLEEFVALAMKGWQNGRGAFWFRW